MLRHPEALSPLADLEAPHFQTVLADETALDAKRVLICSGKIGHELRMERTKQKRRGPAIVMLERMYPFPEDEMRATLASYPQATQFVWVRETCKYGALSFVVPRLKRIVGSKLTEPSSAPPTRSRHRLCQSARIGAEDADNTSLRESGVVPVRYPNGAANRRYFCI